MSVQEKIKEMSVPYFQRFPIFEKLEQAMMQLEKAEEIAYTMSTKDESDVLTTIKIGTTLTLAIIKKIVEGKDPRNFSKEDWNDIATIVSDVAILSDPQAYTAWVFTLYADYIRTSVKIIGNRISESQAGEIEALSEELRVLTEDLEQARIDEADYVDRCLWIVLEAFVKLILLYATKPFSSRVQNLVISVGDYAVQYARLQMYLEEKALLKAYIEHHETVDEELQHRFDLYIADLEKRSKTFETLIQDAFAPDFRDRLKNSVTLAREMGVPEERILDSVGKVDDFFM